MIYPLVRPFLFSLPPEAAHRFAVHSLKLARPFLPLAKPWLGGQGSGLERELWGLSFPNPVGLAAGFDKQAELVDVWPSLGFGFAELGTFTAKAQPGNPQPRLFRYPRAKALINRMGFNNPGAEEAARRLVRFKASGCWPRIPVGINLGKSKVTPLEEADQDYLFSLEKLKAYADYIAINVSSPNTLGLRSLQEPKALKNLLRQVVKAAKPKPVLLKLAPDLSDRALQQATEVALACGCTGLIATNTTLSRSGLGQGEFPEGGLSGRPLLERSTQALRLIAKVSKGKVPLIGVGGIFTAEDVLRKLEAGASLVQVYTGFVYEGPGMVHNLCEGLSQHLMK